jgi:HlyD family secretion protein
MKKKFIYTGIAVVIVVVAIIVLKGNSAAKATFAIETGKVERGNISNTVTATGTLEAITTVEVGTQVSGVIEKIYVDFNTQVKKGQLLAQIDKTPLQAQADQSQANVDNAEAELTYQRSTFERTKALFEKKLIAQSDYDLALYNFNKSQANLKNAKSVHDKNKINLSYASIYSPIDGIILDRAVDEGQTVAASFNTPTLFTIANDLTQMQVEANVDEADIGQVKLGQRVEFTVDAYPELKFDGSIIEIRLQPVETNNVVTYTVIIQAPNPEMKLMPGMTASITAFTKEKKDILVLQGKAIRFNPEQNLVWEYLNSVKEANLKAIQPVDIPATGATITEKEGTFIWVKNGALIQRRQIVVGENDGINYELVSGLNEGDELVLSLEKQTKKEAKATAKSPFMPTRPGAKKTTTSK